MNKGLALVVAGLLVWPLAGVLPARAKEAECREGQGLRCWFIIGEINKKPNRVAYIARHVERSAGDSKRSVEVMQIIESPEFPDRYAIWRMQVDCSRGMFLVQSAKIANGDGLIREEPSYAARWTSLETAKYGESAVKPFACNPDVVRDRTDHLAAFAGTAYRAPDVANHYRQVFWKDGHGAREPSR